MITAIINEIRHKETKRKISETKTFFEKIFDKPLIKLMKKK